MLPRGAGAAHVGRGLSRAQAKWLVAARRGTRRIDRVDAVLQAGMGDAVLAGGALTLDIVPRPVAEPSVPAEVGTQDDVSILVDVVLVERAVQQLPRGVRVLDLEPEPALADQLERLPILRTFEPKTTRVAFVHPRKRRIRHFLLLAASLLHAPLVGKPQLDHALYYNSRSLSSITATEPKKRPTPCACCTRGR